MIPAIAEHLSTHTPVKFNVHLGNARSVDGISLEQKSYIDLLEKNHSTSILSGLLPCDQYCELIEASDIILLPYGPRYRHFMSGIFDDSLFLGKICILPDNSKMALWMNRHNVDCPTFKTWDTTSIINAIDNTLEHYTHYQSQFLLAKEIRTKSWIRNNPIDSFNTNTTRR
ncbi:MAG: hypothetical protein HN790_11480 [Methylococcales bacterium]|nr:hypothetical protein [Methylococcales bacterium]